MLQRRMPDRARIAQSVRDAHVLDMLKRACAGVRGRARACAGVRGRALELDLEATAED